MGRIQVLAPEIASRIAAGEVVERPSSVLKELIENALDAGARRITVEASGGGRSLLRVADDGCGMDPGDCELALRRHATSKISRCEDLDAIKTYGFRGEALFAVAAVSKMSLASRPGGASGGWKVDSIAGEISSSGPCAAAEGTSVEVRELFFNTPARLKFLKSESFEKSKLARVVEEAALSKPGAAFLLRCDGKLELHFEAPPEAGRDRVCDLRQRLSAVLGMPLAQEGRGLLEAEARRGGLHLRLFVSAPDSLIGSRNLQFYFANSRPIASRLLQQALYKAYAEARPNSRHPVFAAFLELPPEDFDVNIHPAKREVRFKNERDIFDLAASLLSGALLKARGGAASVPAAAAHVFQGVGESRPAYSPEMLSPSPYSFSRGRGPEIAQGALSEEGGSVKAGEPREGDPSWFAPPYRYLGRVDSLYLAFEAAGGLFLMDQHAAAERALFEKYVREIEDGRLRVQPLMLPLLIELPASLREAALGRRDDLKALGFSIEPFGRSGVHLSAAPALFKDASDLRDVVFRMSESLADALDSAKAVHAHAAAAVACKKAVKAGDPLGESEAMALLDDLRRCRNGAFCPHGRPSLWFLSREELARRFGRPGPP